MAGGDFVWVTDGATYGDTGWVMSEAVTTVGTSDVTFVQFSGAGSITAGDGLSKSGSTLNVNVDNSSVEISADTLQVKASGVTNAMLAGSIENAKLTNNAITINGTSVSLGGSINVGDITGVSGGKGIDGGGVSGSVTLFLDLNELDTSVTNSDGAYFVVVDSTTGGHKLTKGNINVSGFNNDAGYLTGIAAGSISSTELASASTLLIKNSSGTTLKTVIGAGV